MEVESIPESTFWAACFRAVDALIVLLEQGAYRVFERYVLPEEECWLDRVSDYCEARGWKK